MAEPTDPAGDVRDVLIEELLDKFADDRFPSSTMLDLAEELLRPDELEIYARILLRNVRAEKYPSISMLRRIAALAQ